MARKTILLAACALVAFSLGVTIEPDATRWSAETGLMPSVEARVGRPLTPVSVAGVARRTTRRAVRRTTLYVSALPAGCIPVTINGHWYYECGLNYYEEYQSRYVSVEIYQ